MLRNCFAVAALFLIGAISVALLSFDIAVHAIVPLVGVALGSAIIPALLW